MLVFLTYAVAVRCEDVGVANALAGSVMGCGSVCAFVCFLGFGLWALALGLEPWASWGCKTLSFAIRKAPFCAWVQAWCA